MFGFFKNLLRRPPASPAEDPASTATEMETAAAPARYYPEPASQLTNLRRNLAQQNGKGIELPLQNILSNLPLELQPRIRQQDVGDLAISVPLEKVLAQLSRGAVKIYFGELRQAAPEVFTAENDRDRVLISLPLMDILARLNPALITRRRVQRQVEVPKEISSPFENRGQGLVFSVAPQKDNTGGAQPGSRAQGHPANIPGRGALGPLPAAAAPGAPSTVSPQRRSLTSAPTPAPATAAPVAPIAPALTPQAPIAMPRPAPSGQGNSSHFHKPAIAPTPGVQAVRAPTLQPQPHPAPAPVAPIAHTLKLTPPVQPPAPAHTLTPQPPPPAPGPAPVRLEPTPPPVAPAIAPQPARPPSDAKPLPIAITAIAETWPEVVRKEIVELKLVDAKIVLPGAAVEQGLKQGRIAFSWKTLRSWIQPAVLPAVSAHDGIVLELPLSVVAPLFLSRQQREGSKTQQQKVTIDEDIPNLFFGFPQPEPAVPVSQTTAHPADTNYYVWDDSSDMVRVHESEVKRGPSMGTKFVAKYATPNEVVSRAAALDGVAGVLIALPDGLMVANRLPADVNADTLAAFLPQIFGKVSLCTKELRMGDLNNLNFTVGNVPWKIFRVNAIFFAAFGRAGQPLPTGQLAALAAELDHKPKQS